MENEIKNELETYGFIITEDFINKLSKNDINMIQSQIKEFQIIEITNKGNNTNIYFYDKNLSKIKNRYVIDNYISKGTYNKTYNVSDLSNNKEYVFRILINKIESFDKLVFNITEYFIHTFLYSYFNIHKEYGKNKILKIIQIGYNKNNNFISSINEKMNGTLFFILSNKQIEHSIKLEILIKVLYQIINLLEILQDKFQFMHNDLKSDNIFFKFKDDTIENKYTPENINFFLGDFDASILMIDGIFIGSTHLSPKKDLQKKKDIFLLINSLFFSFNNNEWKTTFFNNFPIIILIANNEKIFHSLYSYEDENINDIYLFHNLKQILDKFSNNKIKTKFKINYD